MEVKEEIKYQMSEMTKDPLDTTEVELVEWEQKCADGARKPLFSSVSRWFIGGKTVIRWPNIRAIE